MGYSYEDKVTWDELAPSVQKLFRDLQTSIGNTSSNTSGLLSLVPIANNLVKLGTTSNTNKLLALADKNTDLQELINKKTPIINLADKKDNILNTVNKFVPEAQYSYNPNKIAKTNSSGKLMLDNLLYELRAGATTADINKLKATKMNSGEIFSSWDRISHTSTVGADKSRQNLQNDDNIEARAAYYYDEATDTICCSRNSGPWSAFISKNTYGPSFKIGFSIPTNVQKTSDDDLVCCILSYMEDSNGCFHTIQVHRNGGNSKNSDGSWCHSQLFCLCYDIYTSWYKSDSKGGRNSGGTDASTYILGYVPPANLTPTNFNDRYCLVNIEKTSTTIKCYTSENVPYANRATAVADKGFTWTMPTSKPSDWPQDMYDNIKYMMQNPCKIGFGTESNEAAFQIDPSRCTGILDEIEIYDLNRGRIQYWDTNTNAWNTSKQKVITDEYIQPNSLIYSNIINKLFWFRRAGNYVELRTNG